MSMVNRTFLGNFLEDLYAAGSLWERFYIYQNYVNRLGFNSVSYTFIPHLQLNLNQPLIPVFLHTNEFPQGFLQQYAEQNLAADDFTLRFTREYYMQGVPLNWRTPMDWRGYVQEGRLLDREAAVVELARRDYGISNGLTIPTMVSEIGVAAASVLSFERDAVFERLKQRNLATLMHCTQLFHDVNYSGADFTYAFLMPFIQTIRPKEIELLRYLATGRNLKAVEDSTGISYGYASNILNDLRARMGGISRDKLMYLFGLINLVKHL